MAEPGVASRSAAERQRAATQRPTLKHGDRLRRDDFERRIDWFELAGGEYRLLPSGDDGAVESRLFPGLRIAVPALLAGNLPAALDAVNRSNDSPGRRRFAARLATRT